MSPPDPVERLHRNRPILIGISLGVLTALLLLPDGAEFPWRYVYLLAGGAIGGGLGWIVAKLMARRP